MYNRYLDRDDYIFVESEPAAPPAPPPETDSSAGKSSPLLGEVSGGISQLLSGLMKHLKADQFDSGDILLILIILLLFLEGDNLEIVITLGLMLLLGLGGE